ncbi:MAG: hypothetical protein VKP70_02335 [Cyanobacteriota bacterium]|nr:hypothetical protein [Cyanobacteriota bacterium]
MPPSPLHPLNETTQQSGPGPLRLVVVGAGLEATVGRPDAPAARAARLLALTLGLPHHHLEDPWSPPGPLGELGGAQGGWLASLPLDPGQPLTHGDTWAEALGAWRQPTLVTIAAPQLASGAAASTLALLRQWRVPVLGLLQWGGAWNADHRRRDGLPWLGRLAEPRPGEVEGDDEDGSTETVAALLGRRWLLLDQSSPADLV